jgi:hypothetical protein
MRVAILQRGAVMFGEGARRSVPSPVVGQGQGWGDSQTSNVGDPPTPNPSPQGGGESVRCSSRRRG